MDTSSDHLRRMVASKPDALSLDDLFLLCANGVRRELLVVLHGMESPTTLSALATRIAEWDDIESEDADLIQTQLYHLHLPKLAGLGVVDYDTTDGSIELTREGRTVAEALTE